MTRRAYLDWNATAPVRPEIAAACAEALGHAGNPSSVHAEGREARRLVEVARARVSALVGALSSEIVFTSGGSEANALALEGAIAAENGITHLLVSSIEHDSVLATADNLAKNVRAARIPVTRDCMVDLAALENLLAGAAGRALVSIMLANNETGAIQPIAEIARLAATHNAIVHTDAVQAPGKLDVDLHDLGVHLMTLSAHKFGGPKGIGALAVRDDVRLARRIAGGGQELGRRAGTENVSGIVGFGTAAKIAMAERESRDRVAALRDKLESLIAARQPDAVIYAKTAARLPNTTCVGVPGISSETTVIALDLAGVAVSAGSACSSGKVKPSHVLTAMGCTEDEAASAIRVSIGASTTEADIAHFIEAWTAHIERARKVHTLHPKARA